MPKLISNLNINEIVILGMVKSTNSLKNGGPSRSLELDFLRLIYAVKILQSENKIAYGHIFVLNEIVETRMYTWMRKYNAQLKIHNLASNLSPTQLAKISAEKKSNANWTDSNAKNSMKITEKLMRETLESTYNPEYQLIASTNNYLGINWDYFGKGVKR